MNEYERKLIQDVAYHLNRTHDQLKRIADILEYQYGAPSYWLKRIADILEYQFGAPSH